MWFGINRRWIGLLVLAVRSGAGTQDDVASSHATSVTRLAFGSCNHPLRDQSMWWTIGRWQYVA
jgi:hypothetical protein